MAQNLARLRIPGLGRILQKHQRQHQRQLHDKVAPATVFVTSDVRERVLLRMGAEYPENIPPMTIPDMFRGAAEKFPNMLALADKRTGESLYL